MVPGRSGVVHLDDELANGYRAVMSDDVARHLAVNVKQLREARSLTQQRLATLAGVPRPTVAHLETGGANPTLAVLLRVAGALQVSIEELIGPPRASARHYPSGTLPVKRRGGAEVRKLLPEATPGMEIDRMELVPGGRLVGVPHTPGTREYLTCESGEVELTASGETWTLSPGDVVVFRGDQKHSYANPGRKPAVAYSVIAFAPGT